MTDQKHNRSPSQRERIREIAQQLEDGVKAVFESDQYKEYLRCMSKFHNYSVNNCLLIAMQRPDASLVAGYQTWRKEHGRQVKKGEKGIKILAPCKYKVETNEKDENGDPKLKELTGFRVITVFDYAQTEGKELPSIGVEELTGDVKGYRRLFKALTRLCLVPIRFEEISGGAKGYYNDAEKVIAIQQGMSQTQTIKTLIHEMMHQKLHAKEAQDPDRPTDRRTKEVEAESAAFCVASAYGIDTSEYSFGYVAGWSSGKETKELKASLERIQTAADEMITGIDQLIEKQNRREKQQDRER